MGLKIGKLIEGLIYEDDGSHSTNEQEASAGTPSGSAPTAAAPTQPAAQQPQQRVDYQQLAGASDGTYVGKVRQSFAENILGEISARNIPGPDFAELKDMFESDDMKQNIPDVNSRWKTAFSMLKMMNKGLTKKVVLDSIDVYINVIEEEKKNALAQIEQKYNTLVGDKELKVNDTENRIMRDEEEIQKLQEKINKINEKIKDDKEFIAATRKEIEAGRAEINVDKADLEATASAIENAMSADKNTLASVLPND